MYGRKSPPTKIYLKLTSCIRDSWRIFTDVVGRKSGNFLSLSWVGARHKGFGNKFSVWTVWRELQSTKSCRRPLQQCVFCTTCRLTRQGSAVVSTWPTTVWTARPITSLSLTVCWRPAWDGLWTRRSWRRPTATTPSTAVNRRQAASPITAPAASPRRWPCRERSTTAKARTRLLAEWTSTDNRLPVGFVTSAETVVVSK